MFRELCGLGEYIIENRPNCSNLLYPVILIEFETDVELKRLKSMKEKDVKYKSGIVGQACVRFGGSIVIDAGIATLQGGSKVACVCLSEAKEPHVVGEELGENTRKFDFQVQLLFPDLDTLRAFRSGLEVAECVIKDQILGVDPENSGRITGFCGAASSRGDNGHGSIGVGKDLDVAIDEAVDAIHHCGGDVRENDVLSKRLIDCNLSVRTLNICKSGDLETVRDIARLKKTDWLRFRNGGKRSLGELTDLLDSFGLTWGMDV